MSAAHHPLSAAQPAGAGQPAQPGQGAAADYPDHRRLGRELGLFRTDPLAGAGLPLWLPAGAVIRSELERLAAEEAVRGGCERVYSPVLAKRELYERSGHWSKFAGDMFPPMAVGGDELVLRPANCPHHALIYASEQRSWRDLPVRLSELGAMFRSELSGVLGGLARVRQINLDDTHVFCLPEQVGSEIVLGLESVRRCYQILGIKITRYRLSLRGPGGGYLGGPELWSRAEEQLRSALHHMGLEFEEAAGEAAFYGPKIDVQVTDPAGREETLSTVQLDFNQPQRFDLAYTGPDGQRHQPVMIHRGVLSAMERLVAHLTELYDGAFPPWLAPVQVVALPIGGAHAGLAGSLVAQLREAGLRAGCDPADATLGARIRRARERRVPYLAVIGDAEAASGLISVRLRDGRQLPAVSAADLISGISAQVSGRSAGLGFGS